MGNSGPGDGPRKGRIAEFESSSNEDSVGKVVEEVTKNQPGHDTDITGIQELNFSRANSILPVFLVLGLCFGGGHLNSESTSGFRFLLSGREGGLVRSTVEDHKREQEDVADR